MRRKDKELLEKNNTIIMVIKLILPILIAVIIFLGIKLGSSTYKMKEIKLSKYISLVEGNKESLVFVTNSNCDTCESTKELLEKMFQGSNIKTYLLSLENLNEEEKTKFMNALEETKESAIAPALLIVSNGKLVKNFYGPFDEDVIIEFLKDASLITVKSETNE